MRRARRIPPPLLALLAVVLAQGLAWTFAVPALQGADEGGHFSYVQQIADAGEVPWNRSGAGLQPGGYGPSVSTEQQTAWRWAGLEPLRGNQAARPLWTPVDEAIWREHADALTEADREDAEGSNAWRNPPLYYLAAAVPYKIVGGSFFDRLYALRVVNVALLLAIVALTWLLAGEVFGRRRALQTVAAGAVALQPVLLDVTTRVTPDALLIALGAAALYLMALIVRRGPGLRLVGLLALTVLAALFTQGRGLALVAPAALAVVVGWWRARAARRPGSALAPGARWALGAGAALVVLLASALYATSFRVGDVAGFLSYLWQFYLPALPGMTAPVGPDWGVHQVYLDRFFATFVQFEVGLPDDLRDGLRAVVWVGLIALVAAAWRHRRALRDRGAVVGVLALALPLTMLALHAAAFRDLLVNPADPIITGRYLLMLVPLYGLGVAAATTAVPGRVRAFATGALLAAAVVLQISALGEVVARFYA